MALSELRRRIAVQHKGFGDGRFFLGPHTAVARRRCGDLRDAAHAHRVVITPGQQRLPGGRTQRRGVKAVQLQPTRGQPLGRRRITRPAEGRRTTEAHIVEQHDQYVGCALGRAQRGDRRVGGVRVFGVIRRQADMFGVRNGQDVPAHVVLLWCRGGLGAGCGSGLVAVGLC